MILGLWEGSDTFDVLRDKTNAAITYLMTLVGIPVGGEIEYKGSPADTTMWDASGIGVVGTVYENFALCLGQGLTGSLLVNFVGDPVSVAPNKKGKFPVGYDPLNAKFSTIGATGGVEAVTLTANQSGVRDHVHTTWSNDGATSYDSGSSGNSSPTVS